MSLKKPVFSNNGTSFELNSSNANLALSLKAGVYTVVLHSMIKGSSTEVWVSPVASPGTNEDYFISQTTSQKEINKTIQWYCDGVTSLYFGISGSSSGCRAKFSVFKTQ